MPPPWHSLHRLDRLLARRVEQADEAEQDEVLRQVGRARLPALDARALEPGQRQHALAAPRACRTACRSARDRAAPGRPSAVCWRSQCSRITSGAPLTKSICAPSAGLCSVAMNRCSDSNGIASMRGDAACSACGPGRAWSRTDRARPRSDRPRPSRRLPAGTAPRRCRAGRRAPEREHGILAGGLAVLLDLALRRVAVAGDLVLPRRR